MERRREEVEERYADTTGQVAGGGEDWKEGENVAPENTRKRGRSPEDDGDNVRVCFFALIICA